MKSLVSINFVISNVIILSAALIFLASCVNGIKSKFLVMIASVILIIANISFYFIFKKLTEIKLKEERLLKVENQLKLQYSHFSELKRKQTNLSRIYHDLTNRLISISGYLKAKDYEKIELEIEKINAGIFINTKFINTGDYCLDALLSAKISKIKKLNINFKYNIILPTPLKICSVDFCIIIGNALDNAIEACEKISNISLRTIAIKIIQSGEYLVAVIENTSIVCDYKFLITKKKDKTIHGFGMQSIQSIVEKYNGNVNIEIKDNSFILKIIVENQCLTNYD